MNTNTNTIRKGSFVTVNVPVLKYDTIPDGGYMPADTVYQVSKISRVTPDKISIYNQNLCSSATVNRNNCTLVNMPVAALKVGDTFSAHWGYDQTNVDYYMIVKVGKKTANLARLPATRKYHGNMHGTTSPVIKNPSELGEGEMHHIKYTSKGTPCFRLNSYSYAFPCQPNDVSDFSEWR